MAVLVGRARIPRTGGHHDLSDPQRPSPEYGHSSLREHGQRLCLEVLVRISWNTIHVLSWATRSRQHEALLHTAVARTLPVSSEGIGNVIVRDFAPSVLNSRRVGKLAKSKKGAI
jgi:hypothetical protein